MLTVALAFLFFAKKPSDFGDFTGKMMAWWASPALLVIFIIVGLFDRKNMRWLRKYWILISIDQWIDFLINGMMRTKPKKIYKNLQREKL